MAVSSNSETEQNAAKVSGRVRRGQQAPVTIPAPNAAQLEYLEKVFRKRESFDPNMVIGGPRNRARR